MNWTPLTTPPTAEDADRRGCVEAWNKNGYPLLLPWDAIARLPAGFPYTHWRSIVGPGEAPPLCPICKVHHGTKWEGACKPQPPPGMRLLPDEEKEGQWIEGAMYWDGSKWHIPASGGCFADKSKHIAIPAPSAGSPAAFDLRSHLKRQREWSEKTFGSDSRAKGVVDHIRKELLEIEADPKDLTEWIDVVILALDGAWRAGYSPDEIIRAIVSKQTRNENRTWPDWRNGSPDKAIEHVREEQPIKLDMDAASPSDLPRKDFEDLPPGCLPPEGWQLVTDRNWRFIPGAKCWQPEFQQWNQFYKDGVAGAYYNPQCQGVIIPFAPPASEACDAEFEAWFNGPFMGGPVAVGESTWKNDMRRAWTAARKEGRV